MLFIQTFVIQLRVIFPIIKSTIAWNDLYQYSSGNYILLLNAYFLFDKFKIKRKYSKALFTLNNLIWTHSKIVIAISDRYINLFTYSLIIITLFGIWLIILFQKIKKSTWIESKKSVNILFNIFDNIEQAQQITTPNKSQTFSSMTTAGTYYYNKYQQQREAADNVVNT